MPRRNQQDLSQDSEWLPSHQMLTTSSADYGIDMVLAETTSEHVIDSSSPNVNISALQSQTIQPLQSFLDTRILEASMRQSFLAYRPLREERDTFIEAIRSGYEAIAHRALLFEKYRRLYPNDCLHELAAHMFVILLATDPRIVFHHAKGDFTIQYWRDPSFRALIDRMQERSLEENRPTVYRVCVADNRGYGHNAHQLAECLKLLEAYYFGIRNTTITRMIQDLNILQGNEGQDHKRGVSLDSMQAFLCNTRRRGSAENDPLSYVGVTTEPKQRRRAHLRGGHGIMAMFYAISSYLYPQYTVHWMPLLLCFEPGQGASGELLFERLGSGLIATGGGFATYPAGTPVLAMNNYPTCAWIEWARLAMTVSNYHEQLDAYQQSSATWQEAKKRVQERRRRESHAHALVQFLNGYKLIRTEDA